MHRFYCTICRKMKRTSTNPNVDMNQSKISLRTGECPKHSRQKVVRIRIIHAKKLKTPATVVKVKSKRG